MRLLIDAGNTRTKWAWAMEAGGPDVDSVSAFDNASWLNHVEAAEQTAFASAVAQATEIWISNVAGALWLQVFESLETVARMHWVSASAEALGVHNRYHDPSQLGSDRWCCLLAAWAHYQQPALVVNAGTAVTIDALQIMEAPTLKKHAVFDGGSIQPGLQLMWQSMQQRTAQLNAAFPDDFLAVDARPRNTQQAMLLGCLHAIAGAVLLQYQALTSTCANPPLLLLSGGDAPRLQPHLSQILSVQAIIVDNLVLRGLASVAENMTQ
ncbi:type III pantothenate kinase [Methylophilus aquaticus]|uniref:Type III pantothenate kinase n=1 Tax=Methylophilus aquaticus TaxID=1971610 RepID=A0ABT9JSL9_9PROT|nr:type III pantothenate kinase [Methylophilus aquaticus]MDP8567573.1 type III pantothenate kinase [Methylophilus aquaticus]